MMKKLDDKSVEELKKSMMFDKFVILIVSAVFSIATLISVLFAYSLDPVLSLASGAFYLGIVLIFLLVLYCNKKLYVFLRRLIEE